MPPFDIQIIHWPTLAAFVAYLAAIDRPSWCHGITNHNTYIPNALQWRGLTSMHSMQQTYIGKGWSAGPHIYLAAECPNPVDRGIWQMTPITHPGVHAGACNSDHLGVENVGDFDAAPPSAAQYQLLLDVNRAILQRWGIPPQNVNVHNECMTGRTCPGKYVTGAQIRADLMKPIPRPPLPVVQHYTVRGLPVYQAQNLTGTTAGYLATGEAIDVDMLYPNGAGHVSGGRLANAGFIDMKGVQM